MIRMGKFLYRSLSASSSVTRRCPTPNVFTQPWGLGFEQFLNNKCIILLKGKGF